MARRRAEDELERIRPSFPLSCHAGECSEFGGPTRQCNQVNGATELCQHRSTCVVVNGTRGVSSFMRFYACATDVAIISDRASNMRLAAMPFDPFVRSARELL